MSKKKVLIIKMGAIGDIVHTSVIPQAIKEKHPDYEIHYLTRPVFKGMLKNSPYIDKILFPSNSLKDTIKALFKERYDVIIPLSHTIKIWLITNLSFPKKIAYRSYAGTSWVENYFNTAKKVFKDIELPQRLYFVSTNEAKQKALDEMNNYPKPHILINPSRLTNNARQGRIWDIKKWDLLSKELLNKYGGTIFVIGNTSEREYHLKLEQENIIILSGKHNLEQTCATISNADLFISGDSGTIHIASAYNIPSISILGSTSPDKIKPYGENGHYIEPKIKCKYCWKKKCKKLKDGEIYTPCIESILPEDVLNKIVELNFLK